MTHRRLFRASDFFGNQLDKEDETLAVLLSEPTDKEAFSEMTAACLTGVISVIERQYKRYFDMDLTAQLRKETQSARSHNIDAEEVMGMFSAAKQKASSKCHFMFPFIKDEGEEKPGPKLLAKHV